MAAGELIPVQELLWVAQAGGEMTGGVVVAGPVGEMRLTLEGSAGRGLQLTAQNGTRAAFIEALFGPVELPDGQLLPQGQSAAIPLRPERS